MGRYYERDEDDLYGGFNGPDEAPAPRAARSNRRRAGRVQPVHQAKVPGDGTLAPRGYRPDIWDLALLFQQKAEAEDLALRAGAPVLYGEINKIMEKRELSAKAARKMISLFWWNYVELDSSVDPLQQFTGMAKDLYDELKHRAILRKASEEIDSREKPEPQIRTRKAPAKPREPSIFQTRPRNRAEHEELAQRVRERIAERKEYNDEMAERRRRRGMED